MMSDDTSIALSSAASALIVGAVLLIVLCSGLVVRENAVRAYARCEGWCAHESRIGAVVDDGCVCTEPTADLYSPVPR